MAVLQTATAHVICFLGRCPPYGGLFSPSLSGWPRRWGDCRAPGAIAVLAAVLHQRLCGFYIPDLPCLACKPVSRSSIRGCVRSYWRCSSFALSGLERGGSLLPRAALRLPWAMFSRPFRASIELLTHALRAPFEMNRPDAKNAENLGGNEPRSSTRSQREQLRLGSSE